MVKHRERHLGFGLHRWAFGLLLPLFVTVPLLAQPSPVDLEERENQLSQERFEGQVEKIEINDRWTRLRFPDSHWESGMSALNAKPSADLLDQRFRDPGTLEKATFRLPDMMETESLPAREKPRLFEGDSKRPRDEVPHRFNDVPIFRLGPERPAFEAMVDDLSLADINRFTFQKNHSAQEGLPVTRAGGEDSG